MGLRKHFYSILLQHLVGSELMPSERTMFADKEQTLSPSPSDTFLLPSLGQVMGHFAGHWHMVKLGTQLLGGSLGRKTDI